jgi:hypothetical protein
VEVSGSVNYLLDKELVAAMDTVEGADRQDGRGSPFQRSQLMYQPHRLLPRPSKHTHWLDLPALCFSQGQ